MSFLAYILIQVGWSSKSIKLTCANMESFTLSQWPLAVCQPGACKLQGSNSLILQSATYRTLPTYQKPIFFAVQQLALGLR